MGVQNQQQAFNRNRNVRRGRRLSRRARHGLNGSQDNSSQDNDEVTNDTRMVNSGPSASMSSLQASSVAKSSMLPPSWSANATGLGQQRLSSFDDHKNNKKEKNGKKKNKKNNKKKRKGKNKKKQNPIGPYPVVSPGTRESAFVH